jgi:hypothetical protein
MPQRNSVRAYTLAFILASVAGSAEALRCPDNIKTDIVYVRFAGCSTAQPALSFEVTVGSETITVSKRSAGDLHWTGRTRNLFVINSTPLKVRADATTAARVACSTTATGLKHGPCVAEFVVQCEPLWVLQLDKTGQATVTSRRENTTIQECPPDSFHELEGPGEVELTINEKLVVKLATKAASECVEASLMYSPFRINKPFKLINVQLTAACADRSVINDTYAQEAFLKQQARRLFPDVVFIKKPIGE